MNILEFKAEDLPSRGITYPEGTIFTVKKFTYLEVQDLNTTNLSVETRIERFCKATTINTDMDIHDLAYIDYIYLHLSRVASVFNNDTLRFPTVCPYCEGKTFPEVKFVDLKTTDIDEYVDIMPFTFPISGIEYSFTHITLSKIVTWFRLVNNIQQYDLFTEIKEQYNDIKTKIDKNPTPDEVLQEQWERINEKLKTLQGKMTAKNKARAVKYKKYGLNALLLAFMCTNFGTEEFDEFLEKIINVDGEELEFLEFVERVLGTGLKPINITCPHCNKIYVINLEDIINDIYPFRRSPEDFANKLRARKEATLDSKSIKE